MTRRIVLTVLLLAACWTPAAAQLPLGHYQPGAFSDDSMGALPPYTGVYAVQYFLYYGSDTVNGPNGHPLTTGGVVRLPNGQLARLQQHIDSFTSLTYVVGMTDLKIFGARYGAGMGIPIANSSVSQALQTLGSSTNFDAAGLGVGDITINPIMLGWKAGRGSVWMDYAVSIPNGRFHGGATNNIGLGFYSHLVQVGGMIPLDKNSSVRLSALVSYEINTKQLDTGVYVGNHLTLEYGLKKQFTPTFSAGLAGYGQWQMSPTTGTPISPTFRDQVQGVGGEVQFVFPKANGTTLVLRAIREFESHSRFQGTFLNLTVSVPIALYPNAPEEKEPGPDKKEPAPEKKPEPPPEKPEPTP